MPPRKIPRSPGRRRGVPNKVTAGAREIFSAFLDHNAPKAQAWLDRVAVKNPGKALELLAKIAEFCLPKLQRTELTGANGAPLARLAAPITDAAEASRVYAQLMSGTEIDIGSVRFEAPAALAAPAPIIEPQPPDEPPDERPAADPNPPQRDDSNVLHLWEKLAK
jgi:hypothetical protein